MSYLALLVFFFVLLFLLSTNIDKNENNPKNKLLNNSIQNSSIINLDDINKAIELTRFNVS